MEQPSDKLAALGMKKIKSIKKRFELTESELAFLIDLNKKHKRKLPDSLAELL